MPLMQGKSSQAFSHNVGAEMNSGKPQDQALAIAYAIKRKNKKANGGMINSEDALSKAKEYELGIEDMEPLEPMEEIMTDEENEPMHMARGGLMNPKHIVGKLMMSKGYANGGEVDDFLSPEESDEGPGGEGEDEDDREGMMERIMRSIASKHRGL